VATRKYCSAEEGTAIRVAGESDDEGVDGNGGVSGEKKGRAC